MRPGSEKKKRRVILSGMRAHLRHSRKKMVCVNRSDDESYVFMA
jgi:hypothetical protein